MKKKASRLKLASETLYRLDRLDRIKAGAGDAETGTGCIGGQVGNTVNASGNIWCTLNCPSFWCVTIICPSTISG